MFKTGGLFYAIEAILKNFADKTLYTMWNHGHTGAPVVVVIAMLHLSLECVHVRKLIQLDLGWSGLLSD